ncbi:Uncharacterized protein OBRU01_21315, partial [Operophtera brumata]
TSIFLHVIGEKCPDVYEQFPEDTAITIESLLKKFDDFFTPKKNITIERHKFFIRNQQEHDTVDQYAFELNKLETSCEFKDLRDDIIRDRLICGLREDGLKERLLRVSDLTLKKTLDICTVAEISRAQTRTVKTDQNEATIHAVEERDSHECALHWVRRNDSALDTGADVNVLPYRFLSQTGLSENDLSSTTTRLISYSGEKLKVLGKCHMKVQCKNKPYIVAFIVVEVDSPPILGKTSCEEMNLLDEEMQELIRVINNGWPMDKNS